MNRTIRKVAVLGSGIMGSGLAEVAARAGYTVTMRSRSLAAAEAMVSSIEKGFAKAIEIQLNLFEVVAGPNLGVVVPFD